MDVDIESLERATLAAVPPQALEEIAGWLVPLDDGTVGRTHSAVPVSHREPGAGQVPVIEARYAERGLPAVFRLPQSNAFDAVRADLAARGYRAEQPTVTMTGPLGGLLTLASPEGVTLSPSLDDDWGAVFMGAGFDPVDGASRFAILRRGRHSVFGSVKLDGQIAGVGLGCFSNGWCGVHGMRTAPGYRRRGLARRILAALAHEAQRRGLSKVFLQVEQANEVAQELYHRAGLAQAWGYEYWRRR